MTTSTQVSDQTANVSDVTENQTKETKGTVSYETYSKVLSEAKKAKERERELEAKFKLIDEQKLKESNQYKELYEQTKAELESKAQALQVKEKAIADAKKLSAFESKLGGKLKKDKYVDFVPLDKIIYDESGVDQRSIDLAVSEFLKDYKELVDFPETSTLPNKAANGAGAVNSITQAEWEKLAAVNPTEAKKRIKDIRG